MKGLKSILLNLKRQHLFVIVGGILLIMGLLLVPNNGEEIIYYYEEKELSKDEAKALVIEKIRKAFDIFENPKTTFEIEDMPQRKENSEEEQGENTEQASNSNSDIYLKVKNYDEIVDELYTEDGKKELESLKFNDKKFVDKREDGIYILSKIPDSNYYKNDSLIFNDLTVLMDDVKAVVSFVRDELSEDDEINYYVYEKKIELIKQDDKWLINAFRYSNV